MRKNDKPNNKTMKKICITAILLVVAIFILKIAPSYIRNEITDRTNLVVNYNNVTAKMKGNVYINEKGVIYISIADIKNYYDQYVYVDEKYNQIITTSSTKVATLPINKNEIIVNSNYKTIKSPAIKKDETYYLPISELEEVYNINVNYIAESDVVVIESLDRELKVAYTTKKVDVKYQPTYLSKKLEEIGVNEKVAIVPVENSTNGWIKVRTENGKIGYIEESKLCNIKIEREEQKNKKQIEGKISLAWEYFSEYAKAPTRTGTKYTGVNVVSPSFFYISEGKLKANVGEQGQQYIQWAKQNGYKVWAMVSNNSNSTEKKDFFSVIVNDYKLRQELINDIVEYAVTYNLDGINLDCENMYQKDKDMYSRLVIELAPRLRDLGIVLSVDVTAPDGSADWSLCYNRNVIGDVADYIVFMAYDQHGVSSKEAGTVAGFNWVENGVNKFLNQEEVDSNKIILGIPFYTRLWKENNGQLTSGVVSMKNLEKVLPDGTQQVWDEECKQNYVEYTNNGTNYKMWIEDEKSIIEKISLINTYDLAGAGFWVKGFEIESIWDVIANKLEIK